MKTELPTGNQNAALLAVLAGLVDLGLTLAAALASHSSVLVADFLKTLLEFVAMLVAWLTLRHVQRGQGQHFDYGLGKLENFSSLLVGGLMLACIAIISFSAVHKIIHPAPIGGWGVAIGLADEVIFLAVNAWLFLKTRRQAAATQSPVLDSQARLLASKAFGNVFILLCLAAGLTLTRLHGIQYLDPLAALVIAGSILFAARSIVISSVYDLLDRTLEESHQLVIIRELAVHFDRYAGLHGIRSRRAGSQVYIEILLAFDPRLAVGDAQATATAIRRNIEAKIRNSHVTIGLAEGQP